MGAVRTCCDCKFCNTFYFIHNY